MDNKNFDYIIKSKLEELGTLPKSADWDRFEKKLEAEDYNQKENQAFDEEIARKTKNFHVDFNDTHWQILKARLEKEELHLTSIYFSKIVEAATVFLIIFTFFNTFHPQVFQMDSEKSQMIPEVALNLENFSGIVTQDLIDIPNPKEKLVWESPYTTVKSAEQITAISTLKPIQIPLQVINDSDITQILAAIPKTSNSYPVYENIIDFNSDQEKVRTTHLLVENIPSADMSISTDAAHLTLSPVQNKKLVEYASLTFHASPTVNIVNSPIDYINKIDAYSTEALGYELGIGYAYRKNKVAMQTGILYARKSYQPKVIDETTGSFFTSYQQTRFQNIQFDVLSIPLSFHYHFLQQKTWSFYGFSGLSFNLVGLTSYGLKQNGETIQDPERFFATLRSSSSVLASKEFNNGILEGGDFIENLYITLDFGFGIERWFMKNTSIYVAPTLRQHIGLAGIGPNSDKVHSLGMMMGLRYRL
ncbi:MAG TPA: hypothetical protein PKC30_02830 [Saprospiraceae bacterium]|nr:hypothetical protein [Saprospiraceae bacterium]